jgi:hypothetical protein
MYHQQNLEFLTYYNEYLTFKLNFKDNCISSVPVIDTVGHDLSYIKMICL